MKYYIFERFKIFFYSKQSLQIMLLLTERMEIHVAQNRTNRGLVFLLLHPLSSELFPQYVAQEQMGQAPKLD
jgi:lauroyl/myristoyl acyltransferase